MLYYCTDAYLDDISASDCRHVGEHPSWGSSWGQGFVWNLTRASVGTVTVTNCQTPSKLEDGSTDVVWDKLFSVAGPLTNLPSTATPPDYGTHWGLKIQGLAPTPHAARVKIGTISCDASDPTIDFSIQSIGAGLYLYAADDVEIDRYVSSHSGQGYYPPGCTISDFNDIVIHNCPRLRIHGIYVTEPGHGAIYEQSSGAGAGALTDAIEVREIVAIDPQYANRAGAWTGAVLVRVCDCHLRVGTVRLTEAAAPAYPTHILYGRDLAADFSASIHIDEVVQNQPLNSAMFLNDPDTSIARVTVGRVCMDGLAKPAVGVKTLGNGATSTAVAAAEVTSWDALSPILAVQPVNASAAALGVTYTIPSAVPASGFSVEHAAAGASDIVSWQSLGYSSLAGLIIPRAWSTLTIVTEPDARSEAAMAYIASVDLTLLFGGWSTAGAELGDTWTFNHNTRIWTQLTPGTSPTARRRMASCYDSIRDRWVIFGGYDGGSWLTETWEGYYTGGVFNWHQITPAHSPAASGVHAAHSMTFDPVRGVCVFCGAVTAPNAKIWEWNGTDWTEAGPVLPNGAYWGVGVVYAPTIAKTVIYGGCIGGGVAAGEIYTWDGTTLALLHTSINAVWAHVMVWDSVREIIVAAALDAGGASISDVCEEWSSHDFSVVTPVLPSARSMAAGVFCPVKNEVMIFGGVTVENNSATGLKSTIVYRRG